jgi:hypothetical protein
MCQLQKACVLWEFGWTHAAPGLTSGDDSPVREQIQRAEKVLTRSTPDRENRS